MSIAGQYSPCSSTHEDGDTDTETDFVIELQTVGADLHQRNHCRKSYWKQKVAKSSDMSAGVTPKQKSEKERKPGLKQRLFGARTSKTSKVPSKFDVVRSIEIVQYSPASDRVASPEEEKELKKDAFLPFKTAYVLGHCFEQHHKPTWCDICEDFIWGLYSQAVRCQYCRYTCHSKCLSEVELECPKAPTAEKSLEELTKETLEILNETGSTALQNNPTRWKNDVLPSFVSSFYELRTIIDEYNRNSALIMTLHPDFTFDGFIRVHMNLNRPVNVDSDVANLTLKRAVARRRALSRRASSASRRPLTELFQASGTYTADSGLGFSVDESASSGSEFSTVSSSSTLSPTSLSSREPFQFSRKNARRMTRKLSFYLPKGTFKPLHVTSLTTAKEVIEALLLKYNVTDNPRKFALFETTKRAGGKELIYRKLAQDEKPLVLCLSWGASNTTRTFSIREDDDGNVRWSAFEIPELKNFLKILQLEEDELLAQIYQKYENYREALRLAMQSKTTLISYPDSES